MNIVLIPCWRRPEFLAITLDHVAKANKAAEQCYFFLVDIEYDVEIIKVIHKFPYKNRIIYADAKPVRGNSYNVLTVC